MVLLRFDKKEKKWIEIERLEKQEGDIYLDNNLRKCLDHYKSERNKNDDKGIVIVGDEGSGKSTIAGAILEYMSDGTFDPMKDLIGSDYLDGLEKIQNLKRKGQIGFDEGNIFFLATETVKREHRDLHKIFSIFRQKNCFFVICLPGFFRLGSYFALDRSDALIRTYKRNGNRGYFAYYGRKAKDKLYRIGKKTYDYKLVKPTFRGRFARCHKLENEEYRSIKDETLNHEINKAKEKLNVKKPPTEFEMRMKRDRELIKNNIEMDSKQLALVLGVTYRRIQQLKNEILA